MIQYKFHFLNEEILSLTQEEFAEFMRLAGLYPNTNIYIDAKTKRGFNMHNMTYFEPEEVEDTTSVGAVVTPPTAAEIRSQQEAVTRNQPTDLGSQLASPELGKPENG